MANNGTSIQIIVGNMIFTLACSVCFWSLVILSNFICATKLFKVSANGVPSRSLWFISYRLPYGLFV